MIKNFYFLSLFFLIINCSTNPGTAFLGPIITGVKSGSIYQTSLSYGSSKALENIKTELRVRKENFSQKKTYLFKKIQDDLEKPSILLTLKIKNIEEGDKIKNFLINHVNKDEFIFSYEWSKGDLVLWDNLSIMHKASEIKNCSRIMHRITIK